MRPTGILLVSLLAYCTASRPVCQGLELAELKVKLENYANEREFVAMAANFYNHLDWIKARFGQQDNNRHSLMLVAVLQLEISSRNYAIKSFLVDKLSKLFEGMYAKPVNYYQNDPKIRDAALEFCLARAKLRAKITMLQANQYHWTALHHLMTTYTINDPLYKQLTSQLHVTLPRDSLEVGQELEDQTRSKAAYFELKEALPSDVPASKWGSERVLNILDRSIDRYFECGPICDQLRVPKWSNAAPLGPNFKMTQWLDTYVGQNILQSIRDTQQEIGQRLRVTNLFDLALSEPELIESFQKKTLELFTPQ